jgi:hypothetical protein
VGIGLSLAEFETVTSKTKKGTTTTMNHLSRRSLVAVGCSVLLAWASGCGTNAEVETSEGDIGDTTEATAEENLGTTQSELNGETCSPYQGTRAWQQRNATLAFNYVIGGSNDFYYQTCNNSNWTQSMLTLVQKLNVLRDHFATGKAFLWNGTSAVGSYVSPSYEPVCGMSAVRRAVGTGSQASQTQVFQAFNELTPALDGCWGAGAHEFFSTVRRNTPVKVAASVWLVGEIDPTGAETTATMAATASSAAAQYYTLDYSTNPPTRINGATTTAYRWGSGCQAGSSIPVGTPCYLGTSEIAKGTATTRYLTNLNVGCAPSQRKCVL